MYGKLLCLFPVLAALIVGCASAPASVQDSFTEGGRGEYVHEHSGVVFPSAVYSYVRGEITVFDAGGYDVGVMYTHPGKSIRAAVIVYATIFQGDLVQHFGAWQDTVQESPLEAQLVNEWEASREDTTIKGCSYTIVNVFNEPPRAELLVLMLYSYKGWYIMYRGTAPLPSEQDEEERSRLMADMMRLFTTMDGDPRFAPTKDYLVHEQGKDNAHSTAPLSGQRKKARPRMWCSC